MSSNYFEISLVVVYFAFLLKLFEHLPAHGNINPET
jgi:hypothetical protein